MSEDNMADMYVSPEVQSIKKRAAKINTNLRFGKFKEALEEAYRLRLFIQTSGFEDPAIESELVLVEEVIRRLENKRFGIHRVLAQELLRAIYILLIGKT